MEDFSEKLLARFPSGIPVITSIENSGIAYLYPFATDKLVVQFNDCGRLGYLFQIVIFDNGKKYNSNLIMHCRYSDSTTPICISTVNSFYPSNIVRDPRLYDKLLDLIDGHTLGMWTEYSLEMYGDIEYEFYLGNDGESTIVKDENGERIVSLK